MSYNRIFTFIVGNRGSGKTFSVKRQLLKAFIRRGDQFIYLRRYDKDIQRTAANYFDDVLPDYPDIKLEYKLGKFYINDEIAGYPLSLKECTKRKSISFPKVKYIVFDEFINEDRDYLGGITNPDFEPELCLNLFQTVARRKNEPIRDDVRFIFIANVVDTTNPYFDYFKLSPMLQGCNGIRKRKSIVFETVLNFDIIKHIEKSQFGNLIKGTRYGNYALENKAYLENENFIEEQPQNAIYICALKNNEKYYGLWFGMDNIVYITNKHVEGGLVYALDTKTHSSGSVQKVKQIDDLIKNSFNYGRIAFTSQTEKQIIMQYLNYK